MGKKPKPDPPKCYIDSNVFLSYVEGIAGRMDAIDSLFDDCDREEREAYTSHLSIAEVAFAKWEKDSSVLDAATEAKIDTFWNPHSPFKLAEVSEPVTRDAKSLIRLSVQHGWSGLRAADAVHLATAKRLKVSEFFTYDEKLQRYDAILGFKIIPPYIRTQSLFTLGQSEGTSDAAVDNTVPEVRRPDAPAAGNSES